MTERLAAYDTAPDLQRSTRNSSGRWLSSRSVSGSCAAIARAYAETRYREDEDPDGPAVLRWDGEGELIDETLDPSYPYTGWTVRREQVLRAADLHTTTE
ncbi:hypothetical protein [Streptomyces sp. SS]|uniref:hypothetical protein n=1 Tax=Streptomyces sp. SS TaxID=260742 RepID=UPI0004751406|nr:hypothetical protein [Streptomyces sp. SS]